MPEAWEVVDTGKSQPPLFVSKRLESGNFAVAFGALCLALTFHRATTALR
jgi:hypothetical protein